MGVNVTYELTIFLSVVLLGLLEGVLFDIFRVIRKISSKTFLAVSAVDVLFWFFATGFFAFFMMKLTNGAVRAYMLVGMILGLIFHFLLFSDRIISIITVIFTLFLKIFKFFLKILLTPTHFLYKMVLVLIALFLKRRFLCIGKISSVLKSGKNNDKKTK